MALALHADCCSAHKRHGYPSQGTVRNLESSLVVHQPTVCALWVPLGYLKTLPTDEHIWVGIITCGGG